MVTVQLFSNNIPTVKFTGILSECKTFVKITDLGCICSLGKNAKII